jgi:ABC-type histidine transport system ATPase subunit
MATAANLTPASGTDTGNTSEVEIQDTGAGGNGDSGAAGGSTEGDGGSSAGGEGGSGSSTSTAADGKGADGAAAARSTTNEFKKSVNERFKDNPKLRDEIIGDRFKLENWNKLGFKSPEEVTALRDAVEAYGGVEGLESLAATSEMFNAEQAQLKSGDPAILDVLLKDNAEGMMKLIPEAVSRMKSAAPEQYTAMRDAMLHDEFTANNVYSHLAVLLDVITKGEAGAQVKAKDLTERLQEYLGKFKSAASKEKNPEKEAWLKEKAEFEKTKSSEAEEKFAGEVLSTVNPEVTKMVRGHIQSLVPKGYTLPKATEDKLLQEVFDGINGKLLEKDDYTKRYDALLKTRDAKRLSRFILSRVEPITFDLAKAVYEVFRGASPTTMKKGAAGGGGRGSSAAAGKDGKDGAAGGSGRTVNGAPEVINRKPTLQEAMKMGFSKEEWLGGSISKKLIDKNKNVRFAW